MAVILYLLRESGWCAGVNCAHSAPGLGKVKLGRRKNPAWTLWNGSTAQHVEDRRGGGLTESRVPDGVADAGDR
ncbi:hypothetical protein HNQ07_001940 [Deinococcus metalli]|nr:hypothetical protein [Deinococcus metalli]MBB5376476.1 hypothetical protein [Deinococcus metalli]